MAILKDEEEQKGQGTSQVLGQGIGQPQQEALQPEQPQTTSSSPATIGGSSATQASAPVKAMPKQQKAGTGTFANLKSYLQAAQGGGQQKVAQAATQQVQRLGAGAQKGVQQAQKAFGTQMEAGSLKGMETAGQEAANIVGAARGVTYQAPQQPISMTTQEVIPKTEAAVPSQPTQPQAPVQQQYFTPEQQQRFAEIINAQYQGPQSIQQAGLYEPAAQKARTAQQAGELTQTALGREQLLRDVFGRGRDYSRGASRLDALLLNASEQGVKQLQEQAQPALQSQQALQAAQNLSANEAARRAAAIEQIRSGAREQFTTARTAEEKATEQRIDDLIKNPARDESGNLIQKIDATGKPMVDAAGKPVYMTEWERLPEYFRESLRNKETANKQIQQEMRDQLQSKYKNEANEYIKISTELSNAESKLNSIRERLKRDSRYPSSLQLSNKSKSKLENEQKILQKKVKTLQASASDPKFKDYLSEKSVVDNLDMKQWVLSPEEALSLGVASGEGLYNIRPEDIKTATAERGRLITQDEFARQQALAQLAGLDVTNALKKDLLYTDASKAGTQDIQRSLDTEAFRNLLNEAQAGFEKSAEGATLTGTGSKKVSRGNLFGKKTSTYYAQVEGNVADMLKQAGYDPEQAKSAAKSILTDKQALENFLSATRTSRDMENNIGGKVLEGGAAGAGTGAGIGAAAGSFIPGVGPAIGAGIGGVVGGTAGAMLGGNTLDQVQLYSDALKELEQKFGVKGLGAVGQGIQDVRSTAGNVIKGAANIAGDNILGGALKGIGGAIGGIDTGAMKAYGEAIAKQGAIEDLKRKYAAYLEGQGFGNRAVIGDTATTRARTEALRKLLERK